MERVIYTALPKELHRQTLYDWGRRGLRSYRGFRFTGSNGRRRCCFDPDWLQDFERIPARAGHEKLLRAIARLTREWVAVARKRGALWPVDHYLVPRAVADQVRMQVATQEHLARASPR